ncbi:Transforming acidic coiled-coil-containing protein 3 [Eumeta japonica]|uniref:Transforming acidic coiled-coil-containing protein 3 n=1 Tax=Eumeta variegata TaxID=151549 RepID=A0A4C1UDK2_EUMVA|nr:Transforming acidic coiled-coil-containing protein 3 [Eumeta japonica]
MTSRVEPMDIDDVDSEFDNKENAYQSNVFSTKANIEKGYEELEVSEMNMRLRYSITPSSSPMSKSFTTVCNETKNYDRFDKTLNSTSANDPNNLTQPWGPVSCPTETNSLVLKNISISAPIPTENVNLTSTKSKSSMTLNDNLVNNNETILLSGRDEECESAYPSSSSSPLPNILVPNVSAKEIPKSLDSPIMRGLKSVLNIFRSSQSPILPSTTDKTPETVEKAHEVTILSPDGMERDIKTNPVLSSTPICNSKTKEETGSKRNSPYKDSIVFNEDLVSELQWNNETTILFGDEKIPIHKLLLQRAHSPMPESNNTIVKTIKNDDILNQNIVLAEDGTNSVLTNISSNEQERLSTVTQDNFVVPCYSNKASCDSLVEHQDDSEFLDCENTYINNDLYLPSIDTTITFNKYPEQNETEDSDATTKSKIISEVFEKVVVPNIIKSSVTIEKQQNVNEQSDKNEILNQNNVIKDATFYGTVESQDEFKINNDVLLPNIDRNDVNNLTYNCEEVSSSGSKMLDKKTIDCNSPNIQLCSEYVSQNDIQTLKQMALEIVHAEYGMIEIEDVFNKDLLQNNVSNKNTSDDSVLKLKISKGGTSEEISEVNNSEIIQCAHVTEDPEMKRENHLTQTTVSGDKSNLLVSQEKLDATFLANDTGCSDINVNTNSIQNEFLEVQSLEEVLLLSENHSPYISFKAEEGHNIEDVVTNNLEYRSIVPIIGESLLCQNSFIQNYNQDQLNDKTNEAMSVENTCSMFDQNQLLDCTIASVVNTATEVVENTINVSMQVIENIDGNNEKTCNDNIEANMTYVKDVSQSNTGEEKGVKIQSEVSNSESNVNLVSAKLNCTGEEIKVDFDSVVFNDGNVENKDDVMVGALDSLVSAATEIVANVISISTHYVETINETEKSLRPNCVLETVLDSEVSNGNISNYEINVEVAKTISMTDMSVYSENEIKADGVDTESKDTVLKSDIGEANTILSTSTVVTDLTPMHDNPSNTKTHDIKEDLLIENFNNNACASSYKQMFDSKEGDVNYPTMPITQEATTDKNENLSICFDDDAKNKSEVPIGALATLISTATDVVVNVITSPTSSFKEITRDTELQNHDIENKNVVDNKINFNETEITKFPYKENHYNCKQQKVNIISAAVSNEILESKNDAANSALRQRNENDKIDLKQNTLSQENLLFMEGDKNSYMEQSVHILPTICNEERSNAISIDFDNHNFNPFMTRTKIRQSPPILDTTNVTEHNFNQSPSKTNDLHQPDVQEIQPSKKPVIELIKKNDTEIHDSIEEEQFNFNIDSDNSKESESKNATIRELLTEEEDTVEGPFFDTSNSMHPVEPNSLLEREIKDTSNAFSSRVFDLKQIHNLNREDDLNHESGEVFIDADAFDFFMNQNGNNVNETGKESLFLKFDPLCANKVDASGVVAILSKIQDSVSTSKSETLNDQLQGSSTVNFVCNSLGDVSEDLLNISMSRKPMMAVPPAVNNDVSLTHSNRLVTPTRLSRQTNLSSPAIAIIDRLISISANNSPVQGLNFSQDTRQLNESETILAQLKEALNTKEQDLQQLRIESGELKDRLCTLESHMNKLEKDNEEKLRKINDLNETLLAKTKMNKNMAAVVEEYERTIAGLIAESEQEKKLHEAERVSLMRERDEQTAHLGSMEVSFSDLHSKYEKSKQIILSYKTNEDKLRKSIADFEDTFKKMQNNYDLLKQHATSKLNAANQEFHKLNKAHEAELLKLNAMIKRKELHITSLEETLSHKIKANEELTAICDELINKVS